MTDPGGKLSLRKCRAYGHNCIDLIYNTAKNTRLVMMYYRIPWVVRNSVHSKDYPH